MAKNFLDELQKTIKDQTNKTPGLVGNLHGVIDTVVAQREDLNSQSWYVLSADVKTLPSVREFAEAFSFQRLPVAEINASQGTAQFPDAGTIVPGRATTFFASVTVATADVVPLTINAPGHQIAVYVDDALVVKGSGSLTASLKMGAGSHFVAVVCFGGTSPIIISTPEKYGFSKAEPTPPAPVWAVAPTTDYLKAQNGSYIVTLQWLNDAYASAWQVYRTEAVTRGNITSFTPGDLYAVVRVDQVLDDVAAGSEFFTKKFHGGQILLVTPGASYTDLTIQLDPHAPTDAPSWLGLAFFHSTEVYHSIARVTHSGNPTLAFNDTTGTQGSVYVYRITAFGFISGTAESDYSTPDWALVDDLTPPGKITFDPVNDILIVNGEVHLNFTSPTDEDYAGVKVFYDDGTLHEIQTEFGKPSVRDALAFRPSVAGQYWFLTFDTSGNVNPTSNGSGWVWDGTQNYARAVSAVLLATVSGSAPKVDLALTVQAASVSYPITAEFYKGSLDIANRLPLTTGGGVNITDAFNRADNAGTLGNTDTGQSYIVYGTGAFGIATNRAYAPSNDGTNRGVAVVESGASDIKLSVTFAVSATSQRVAFRYSDIDNGYIVNNEGSAYVLYKLQGGSYTNLGSYTTTCTDGDLIEIVAIGNAISVRVNGIAAIYAVDTFNNAATQHGIGTNDSTHVARWENLSIVGVAGVLDGFNRTANSSAVGTADTGHVWQALGGAVFGIDTNSFVFLVSETTHNENFVVVDPGVSDGAVQVTFAGENGQDENRIVWRCVDKDNLWMLTYSSGSGGYVVYKRVAGADTLVVQSATPPVHSGVQVTVVVSGANHSIRFDGVEYFNFNDSTLQTATKFGIGQYQIATGNCRYDNFSFVHTATGTVLTSHQFSGDGTIDKNTYVGLGGIDLNVGLTPFWAKLSDRDGHITYAPASVTVPYIDGNVKLTLDGSGNVSLHVTQGAGTPLSFGYTTNNLTFDNDVGHQIVVNFTSGEQVVSLGALSSGQTNYVVVWFYEKAAAGGFQGTMKKDQVVYVNNAGDIAPQIDYISPLRDTTDLTNVYFDIYLKLTDSHSLGGTLKAWVSAASTASSDPTTAPDATLSVPSTPQVYGPADWSTLHHILSNNNADKLVYFEFVNANGQSSGKKEFKLPQLNNALTVDGNLKNNIIDVPNFVANVRPYKIVSVLPGSAALGDIVFLTTDTKLYRWNGTVWTASVPTSDLNGTIDNSQIADAAITASKILDNDIPATKFLAGTIGAREIAANSITADRIILTDFTNVAIDADCEHGRGQWPTVDGQGGTIIQHPASDWGGCPRPFFLECSGSSAGDTDFEHVQYIKVNPGEVYVISIFLARTTADFDFAYGADLFDASKTHVSWDFATLPASTPSAGFTRYTRTLNAIPAGVYYIRPWISARSDSTHHTGTWLFTDFTIRRASNAELIVDGSIIASKIAAATITGDKISAGTITAGLIAAGAIVLKRAPNIIVARKSSSASGTQATARLQGLGYTVTETLTATVSDCRAYDIVVIDAANFSAGEHNTFVSQLVQDGQKVWVAGNDSHTDMFYITNVEFGVALGTAQPGSRAHPLTTGWSSITDADTGDRITDVVGYAIPLGTYSGDASAYPIVVVPDPSGGTIVHQNFQFGIGGSDNDQFMRNVVDFLIGVSQAPGAGSIRGTYITDREITAAKISAGTITANEMAANSITASQIQAGAVTAGKISITQLSDVVTDLGIIVSGVLRNSGSTRYLNLNADGTGSYPDFLHHEGIQLKNDGSATFSGTVASSSFSATSAAFAGSVQIGGALSAGLGFYPKLEFNGLGGSVYGRLQATSGGVDVNTGELFVGGTRVAKVISSTSTPSGSAPEGTLWVQY